MYDIQTFTLPELKGISEKNIEEHLKLYAGYVNNTNMILETIQNDSVDGYALAEMQRRFSFEFNGMKNHEYYFQSLEGGAKDLSESSDLYTKIIEQWGSFDAWLSRFKTIAKTRGVGWAILYHDRETDMLVNTWVDEQHLGHLNSCQYIVGIDMWEHAFVADYQPSGKGQYIEDYFANLNWSQPERLFASAHNG
jgi:Fe-Mn family superoxide dismutase